MKKVPKTKVLKTKVLKTKVLKTKSQKEPPKSKNYTPITELKGDLKIYNIIYIVIILVWVG